jgi:hypothetical protein
MMSEGGMTRFIQGEDRAQQTLFPGCLDDHVADDNPARVVDAYVDQLDLRDFDRAQPADTGRPGYAAQFSHGHGMLRTVGEAIGWTVFAN